MDRIKRIGALVSLPEMADLPEEVVKRDLCLTMGRAIAEKLFEFCKVEIRTEGGIKMARAVFDVIVPYGPPSAP